MHHLQGEEQVEASAEYEEHRMHASEEYAYYKIRNRQFSRPDNITLHLVFDFAEKVLLSFMEKLPGNLHFVTDIKHDMFGMSNSNLKQIQIFSLPEGHWPGSKGPDSVISILYYAIDSHQSWSAQNPA